MVDYDIFYKTENLFGEPYTELIDFFKNYEPKGKLIDVGCGQGRDAIPLARLGYEVTGIDNSKLGIKQMLNNNEGLKLTGLVEDIYKFDKYQDFDIVLLNSMFHFEKKDKKRETDLIIKIANAIKPRGIICICIQDTGSKVKILKEVFENSTLAFKVVNDSSLVYKYEDKESGHKSETKYTMYIVQKI